MTAPEFGHLHDCFDAQRTAVSSDPNPPLAIRLDRIKRVAGMLDSHADDVSDAVRADFGSLHPAMVVMLDTLPVTDRAAYFAEHLESWLEPRPIKLGAEHGSSSAEIIRVPKGVNGNIAPWNFPIESALVMTIDMLAAGNTVIVKPSELAPATAELLATIVPQHFAPDEFAIVQGGAEVAQAFAAMPWDHLTYTGGGRVGRLVAEAAARNLVPLTLELGGKNPAVFAPDAVDDALVGRFLSFRALKAGQICTSPDYALVHRGQVDAWVEIAVSWWTERYPFHVGHPDATAIINDHHYHRVEGYVAEARARNVRVVGLNADEPDPATRQFPLTLIVDPPEDLACMAEEMFGPVVPVVPYDSIDEALARINRGPAPLGAYLASRDDALAARFVATVRSGGTGINTFGLQGGNSALPFGGFGASGNGCHSGYEGFCNYSHTKSVFRGSDDSFVHQVIEPPYERS